MRDGDWQKEKFPEFLRRAGITHPRQPEEMEKVVQDVYGCDVAGLEAAWKEYWSR